MSIRNTIGFLVILTTIFSCTTIADHQEKYESDQLIIARIDKNCFTHISYLKTENFGKVKCNGMIYINSNEAIVFDTPTNDAPSKELIEYIENDLKSKVKNVVMNHFHVDCLGGLKEFHNRGIESYSNEMTIKALSEENSIVPKNGFKHKNELKVGNEIVQNQYFGEGHTPDNIVCYIPRIKFCLEAV